MELSYYISEIRQSIPTDYKNIDDRMIIRLLNEFRSVYIKNEYNKNKTMDFNLTQEIAVEMEIADESTMDVISTTSRVLRSKQIIPDILKISNKELVLATRNAKLLSENYNYITREKAIHAGNGKFNTKDIFTFIHNDKLHCKLNRNNPKIAMLTFINIQAIFQNPLECKPFQFSEYVDDRDYDYPMTDYIWGYVKSNLLKESFGVVQSNTTDRLQDGK